MVKIMAKNPKLHTTSCKWTFADDGAGTVGTQADIKDSPNIPDNAIITDFVVDITTAFQSAGTSEITLFIAQSGTPITLISARPFNNGGGGAFFHALGPKGGTTYNFFGGKTDGVGALSLTVGDAALQTAGEARVYVKYIIGT